MQKKWLVLILGLFSSPSSFVQAQSSAAPPNLLEEIIVSATRSAQQSGDVPSVVTKISRQQIQERGMRDIRDIFQNELDVSVRSGPTRFAAAGPGAGRSGNDSINIRGLEGNQVLLLIDGIRVPNSFTFASFSTGRGDFMEVNGIRSVEVLRGPASTQFGSDGLAGAVLFHTVEPADLVRAGQTTGGYIQTGYHSVDASVMGTAGVARLGDQWDVMFLASYRTGSETDNQGQNHAADIRRTAPNPADSDAEYALSKIQYHYSPSHSFGLTLEKQQRHQTVDVLSARAMQALTSQPATLSLNTDDTIQRDRVSLHHTYIDADASFIQKAETLVYWQWATVEQKSFENRTRTGQRSRVNQYDSDSYGVSTVLESQFSSLQLPQKLTYGWDVHVQETAGMRDGTAPPYGETFPVRPFPDTRYTLMGAFVQNDMTFSDWVITPALRFDSYRLNPTIHADDAFTATRLSDQAITPRVGAVWNMNDAVRPFFQWSYGFRAPTPDQVNNGFKNDASGYQTIGNAELKAETAKSLEIGVRGQLTDWQYSIAAYDNHYDDFISQETIGGSGIPYQDPLIFQYVNVSKAHIWGIDIRTQWDISNAWKATAGVVFAKGDTTKNGVKQPLETVNPLKAALGLRYDATDWGTHAQLNFQQAKSPSQTLPVRTTINGFQPAFAPPSWYTLDIGSYWKPHKDWAIQANIHNVFDRSYWLWSDVRGLESTSSILQGYTAAGRNFQLSARYQF